MRLLRRLLGRLGFTWRTLTPEESAVVRAVARGFPAFPEPGPEQRQ